MNFSWIYGLLKVSTVCLEHNPQYISFLSVILVIVFQRNSWNFEKPIDPGKIHCHFAPHFALNFGSTRQVFVWSSKIQLLVYMHLELLYAAHFCDQSAEVPKHNNKMHAKIKQFTVISIWSRSKFFHHEHKVKTTLHKTQRQMTIKILVWCGLSF